MIRIYKFLCFFVCFLCCLSCSKVSVEAADEAVDEADGAPFPELNGFYGFSYSFSGEMLPPSNPGGPYYTVQYVDFHENAGPAFLSVHFLLTGEHFFFKVKGYDCYIKEEGGRLLTNLLGGQLDYSFFVDKDEVELVTEDSIHYRLWVVSDLVTLSALADAEEKSILEIDEFIGNVINN